MTVPALPEGPVKLGPTIKKIGLRLLGGLGSRRSKMLIGLRPIGGLGGRRSKIGVFRGAEEGVGGAAYAFGVGGG